MPHQLTLEIPDEVYQPLQERARVTGQTVEAVVRACLAQSVEGEAPGSRLRRWAGAFDSGLPAISSQAGALIADLDRWNREAADPAEPEDDRYFRDLDAARTSDRPLYPLDRKGMSW